MRAQLFSVLMIALFAANGSVAQTSGLKLTNEKGERCLPKRASADQIRCFAWAKVSKSGSISGSQARCTEPDFVSVAKNCLDAHRVAKEQSGVEQQVCVEIKFTSTEVDGRFGVTSRISSHSVRVLPDCAMAVGP